MPASLCSAEVGARRDAKRTACRSQLWARRYCCGPADVPPEAAHLGQQVHGKGCARTAATSGVDAATLAARSA